MSNLPFVPRVIAIGATITLLSLAASEAFVVVSLLTMEKDLAEGARRIAARVARG